MSQDPDVINNSILSVKVTKGLKIVPIFQFYTKIFKFEKTDFNLYNILNQTAE